MHDDLFEKHLVQRSLLRERLLVLVLAEIVDVLEVDADFFM